MCIIHFNTRKYQVLLFVIASNLISSVVYYGSASIGLWKLIAWISLPVCILKQLISVVHLITASHNIANVDLAERKADKKN